MKHKIAGFSYIYNGVKFDIPFIESIKSVIDVVDQFVLTECYSEDETWERCLELQKEYPDKLKLLRTEWVSHFTEICNIANWTALHIDTDIEYIFQLQSDEVMHEKDLDTLLSLPQQLIDSGKTAARWKYHHFLGGPNITFPFCYSELVRFVKRRTGWDIIGDGVQFAINEGIIEERVLPTDITVFHYGKMKSPEKGFQKEISFQNLYTDIGFPDPKMAVMKDTLNKEYCDYVYLFRDHIINKTIYAFEGTHPKAMQKHLENFKNAGYEQLLSTIEKDLEIKL